ncbi:hypothetical protein LTR66_007719 [Elasticomyces elasticus]|nr:hypothetical protein LTR50_005729 [Elasticomyces elasticus]KAK4986963.1 hypothetical protein LTR66_007719 [Elasticomyces elasticus]
MVQALRHVPLWTLILLATGSARSDRAPTTTHKETTSLRPSSSSIESSATCQSRTVNYITSTLPQQCLVSSRTGISSQDPKTKIANVSRPDSHVTSSSPSAALSSRTTTLLVDFISSTQTAHLGSAGTPQTVSPAQSSDSSERHEPAGSTPETGTSFATSSSIGVQPESETDSPLDNANFLSFEDWKKQNLAKVGQNPENIGHGRGPAASREGRRRPGINNALDGLGEDSEIELDFAGFGVSPGSDDSTRTKGSKEPHLSAISNGDATETEPASPVMRSKDAGKTCKERSNYASFDCAANVLKSNPECKSVSSILVENKDSYMLNICSASNKFFIVELCADILIDTVVLANYEFFSSMFRTFRLSVSDRYPVKLDRWKQLGVFEARNSREVQAFLVEQPLIWARYLRIEFLTHYGNEYYCPVSLLRVHGTTMMEEFRYQEEAARGELDADEDEEASQTGLSTPIVSSREPLMATDEEIEQRTETIYNAEPNTAAVVSSVLTDEASGAFSTGGPQDLPQESALIAESMERGHGFGSGFHRNPTSPSNPLLSNDRANPMCYPAIVSKNQISLASVTAGVAFSQSQSTSSSRVVPQYDQRSSQPVPHNESEVPGSTSSTLSSTPTQSAIAATFTGSGRETSSTDIAAPVSSQSSSAGSQNASRLSITSSKSSSTSTKSSASAGKGTTSPSESNKPPSSTSHAASASPTTQESFFKSVHKRLQSLEANSTLSLQYIEEQSRILRDAFTKVEKRQISKTENFLNQLNSSVMLELHGFRHQYDQLWQSTVIELENHREQYQREILEVSRRLTIVADELVFQKRMSIVQSTLLLLCLGLVLFAKSGNPALEMPLVQNVVQRGQTAWRSSYRSPSVSPRPGSEGLAGLRKRKRFWPTSQGTSLSEPESSEERFTSGPLHGNNSASELIKPTVEDEENNVPADEALMEGERDIEKANSAALRQTESGPSTPSGTRDMHRILPT